MNFIKPKYLQEALEAKKATGFPVIAGGTDILAQWKGGVKRPEGIVSLLSLQELRGVTLKNGSIVIGALSTHSEISASKEIRENLPALANACGTVGAEQIQNMGTIGGNIMNASPAGDTMPVLLAYEAVIELEGLNGKRSVPISEFYKGYKQTQVKGDELLTKIIIPNPKQPDVCEFYKVGTRKAQAISKICGCFRKTSDGKYLIAFGSVAPVPIRCFRTEEFVFGKKLTPEVIRSAKKLIEDEVSPIDDIRSNVDYRKFIVCSLLEQFFKKTK